MSKLISKFEDIEGDYKQTKRTCKGLAIKNAEEAKKIAIEFILWKAEQPNRIIKLSDYSDTISADEIYRIELEKEFEQFIEEYYE